MDTKYHERVQNFGEQHPDFHSPQHMAWLRRKQGVLKRVEVYDNDGETWDRYTVIIDGDVFGMSENALSPQGFNQWSGSLKDLPGARQGERITLESLPEDVQTAIDVRVCASLNICPKYNDEILPDENGNCSLCSERHIGM